MLVLSHFGEPIYIRHGEYHLDYVIHRDDKLPYGWHYVLDGSSCTGWTEPSQGDGLVWLKIAHD